MNKPCERCNGTGHIVTLTESFGLTLLERVYGIKVTHCLTCNGFGYLAEPVGEEIPDGV